VLPFENLSEDKAYGYFADGFQDQILTGLAKIGDLKVISRTSTQKYAARPENLSQIARELGVEHILEGSVQRAGNKVRINVQLIEAATDSHLWAETYDRTLEDIFAVESEVAQKIAESLAANLSRGEREALAQKPTDVPAAYAAYLRGRALVTHSLQTREQADRLLDAYREAVRLDPKFALAWAELARECFRIAWAGLDPAGELNREGTKALAQATALAPTLPQAELARGVRTYYVERDFPAALATMRGLKARLPNDSDLFMFIGFLSRRLGEFQESSEAFARASELSPNDGNIAYHHGVTLVVSGDCTRGLPQLDAALALTPDNTHALAMKMQCAWYAGKLDNGDAYLDAADASDPSVMGLRGMQAMLRHDFAGAAVQFRQASASSGDTVLDAFLNGYVPARMEYDLQLALAKQRLGAGDEAERIYRRVQAEAAAALAARPENSYVEAGWRSVLGFALAGLGQRAEAAEQGRRVMALVPEQLDQLEGPGFTYLNARILAANGDAAAAVPLLRHLLQRSTALISAPNLRLDPVWDPLRADPGFRALLAGTPP
jgi:TolB-like protein/Tfp pilus assembly protein PilF